MQRREREILKSLSRVKEEFSGYSERVHALRDEMLVKSEFVNSKFAFLEGFEEEMRAISEMYDDYFLELVEIEKGLREEENYESLETILKDEPPEDEEEKRVNKKGFKGPQSYKPGQR